MSAYTFSRARAETRRDRRHVSVPRGACRSGPAIVFQAGDWTAKGLALPAGDTTLTVTRTAQDQTTAQAQASVTRPADATQFTHDPNGNMLGEGLWQYTWDEENRLVAVTPTGPAAASRPRLECVYDGLGRRRLRRTYSWDAQAATWTLQAETRFVWDSWVLLRETTVTPGNGETLNRLYTCGLDLSGQLGGEGQDAMATAGGIGGILAVTSSSSALPAPSSALFLYDGNGNVANLVDAESDATLATYEYGPFGNTLVASGPLADTNPIRFSSKYFEGAQPPSSSTQPPALSPQPSLYYYGLRYYSPGLGRWASRDPIGERGGVNCFAFLANDGPCCTDLLGLLKLLVAWGPDDANATGNYAKYQQDMSDALKAFVKGMRLKYGGCCTIEPPTVKMWKDVSKKKLQTLTQPWAADYDSVFLWGHGEPPDLQGESRFQLDPFAEHLTDVFPDPSKFLPREMWIYSCYSNKLRLPTGGKFGLGVATDGPALSGTIYNAILDAMQEKIAKYYEDESRKCQSQPPSQGGDGSGGYVDEHP